MTLSVDSRVSEATRDGDAASAGTSLGLQSICRIQINKCTNKDASGPAAVRIRPQDDVTVVGPKRGVRGSVRAGTNVDPVGRFEQNPGTGI